MFQLRYFGFVKHSSVKALNSTENQQVKVNI